MFTKMTLKPQHYKETGLNYVLFLNGSEFTSPVFGDRIQSVFFHVPEPGECKSSAVVWAVPPSWYQETPDAPDRLYPSIEDAESAVATFLGKEYMNGS